MTLSPALQRFRLAAAVLLVAACLQAMAPGAFGFERRHGSAFDISTVEVSTAPVQRKIAQAEVQRVVPFVPFRPAPLPPVYVDELSNDRASFGLPPQTGPPLGREIASLALAPRAPPQS